MIGCMGRMPTSFGSPSLTDRPKSEILGMIDLSLLKGPKSLWQRNTLRPVESTLYCIGLSVCAFMKSFMTVGSSRVTRIFSSFRSERYVQS
jgi:hypothetical protein